MSFATSTLNSSCVHICVIIYFYENYQNHFPTFPASSAGAPVTLFEFDSTISSMKGKTPGADKISYPILRNIPFAVKSRLVTLYNSILDRGLYPQEWKTAAIIPIPKPNKPNSLISNYRPISLLPCMAKVLEKIISRRLMWFAEQNDLINPHQFAFRKGMSVIDPLLLLDHFTTKALSSKNHVSVLSLDFEKAYDRIGAHCVLQELKRWKVGEKIYKVVKSFLCNRKFFVRANNQKSKTLPLFNGIPQGSPLSVILFTIAFNVISRIISSYPQIEHFVYADDVLIFSKIKDLTIIQTAFSNILADLNTWSKLSGANLSVNKSTSFHICRKHKCIFPTLFLFNCPIPNTNSLKILGIIFDKRYTFKKHCEYVRLSLFSRLNIIKYLSSKHCLVHLRTLINITKAIILSKIDFGLTIYGNCARTHIKRLQTPYHAAARRSIRAFPTSPIKVILAEAGLPAISQRVLSNSMMLIPKILHCRNKLLLSYVESEWLQRDKSNSPSAISRVLNLSQDLNIVSVPALSAIGTHPLWLAPKSVFITSLLKYPKSSTSPNKYRQLYYKSIEPLRDNWEFIFTDGSKSETSTTFAVTNELGDLISVGAMPTYCSIFTAEAAALFEAVRYASLSGNKYVICSDSKSTFEALASYTNNTPLVEKIQKILLKHKDSIKIMWIPGHAGIPGNEKADELAKEASKQPLHLSEHFIDKDIKKLVKKYSQEYFASDWFSYHHYYKNYNPRGKTPIYPSNVACGKLKIFVRLKIGHTLTTHTHLLKGSATLTCSFCGSTDNTVLHLLDVCEGLKQIRTSIFNNTKPSSYLSFCDIDSINIIHKFIYLCKVPI